MVERDDGHIILKPKRPQLVINDMNLPISRKIRKASRQLEEAYKNKIPYINDEIPPSQESQDKYSIIDDWTNNFKEPAEEMPLKKENAYQSGTLPHSEKYVVLPNIPNENSLTDDNGSKDDDKGTKDDDDGTKDDDDGSKDDNDSFDQSGDGVEDDVKSSEEIDVKDWSRFRKLGLKNPRSKWFSRKHK